MSDQLPLFPDATVDALISRDTCEWSLDGLAAYTSVATAEQLQRALELLPEELTRGRGPVLSYQLRKRERAK